MIRYGTAPIDLGGYEIETPEMKYYLYLPVKIPGQAMRLPRRLSLFNHIVHEAWCDYSCVDGYSVVEPDTYVYLTVKTMPVQPGSPGNRPGWHADGYGSGGDINYIWYDKNPTEFAEQVFSDIPNDDTASMSAFEAQASNIVTYPCRRLLRLDESVVHRVGPVLESGVRTFVKITISKHKLNRQGNSRNYELSYNWPMVERNTERNLDHG